MAKVTGIGGIFFKSTGDRAALTKWYQDNLSFSLESFWGAIFNWQNDKANDGGLTVWHVAEADSQWFKPSETNFMINYRVDNLDELLAKLKANNVTIIGQAEQHENGKFAWIIDPEGNKVELWEPMLWDDKNKTL